MERDKIVSLTALFLTNTINHMGIKTATEVVSILEKNILDEIENLFNKIENCGNKEKKLSNKVDSFAPRKKWDKFTKGTWGYECLVLLREVKISIESTDKNIAKDFINEVKKYHKNDWPSKADKIYYKFSVPSYNKIKNYKKYVKLSLSQIDMLSEGLIVLFFEKNNPQIYKDYINWMKDTGNFFCLKKGRESVSFSYHDEEFDTIKKCVDSYHDFEEFNRNNFLDFIRNIFYILDNISGARQEGILNNEEKKGVLDIHQDEFIRTEIDNYYHKLFNYPEGTIGLIQDEINDIFWRATNDVIESFYYLEEKENLTWEECVKNRGFTALMRYRLYYYLSCRARSDFIVERVAYMVSKTKDELGIYISEKAQIKTKIWMEDNCFIEDCRIEEDCHIKNCHIESDVVLCPRVNFLADSVWVKRGNVVGPDVDIRGAVVVTIDKE